MAIGCSRAERDGRFHSAHTNQQQTGRDVVSFGIGGAGSAEAMVLRPAAVLPSSKCSVFPTIDQIWFLLATGVPQYETE
jgi:hypothetical protein